MNNSTVQPFLTTLFPNGTSNGTSANSTIDEFPSATRVQRDAWVYLGGGVFWFILIAVLYATNFMWFECLSKKTMKVRKEHEERLKNQAIQQAQLNKGTP